MTDDYNDKAMIPGKAPRRAGGLYNTMHVQKDQEAAKKRENEAEGQETASKKRGRKRGE